MKATKSQSGRQVTVSPCVQLIPSRVGKYRARKMIDGVRHEFRTNNLREARKWINEMNRKAENS